MNSWEDKIELFIENSIKERRFDSNIKKIAILQIKKAKEAKNYGK